MTPASFWLVHPTENKVATFVWRWWEESNEGWAEGIAPSHWHKEANKRYKNTCTQDISQMGSQFLKYNNKWVFLWPNLPSYPLQLVKCEQHKNWGKKYFSSFFATFVLCFWPKEGMSLRSKANWSNGRGTCSCHLVVMEENKRSQLVVMEEQANKRSQISSPYTISVIRQDDNVIMWQEDKTKRWQFK